MNYRVDYAQQLDGDGLRMDALFCASGVSALAWYLLFIALGEITKAGLLGSLSWPI
ncbi:MAG: hypothetical protein GY727_08330 [Gammaproteobacteria bacterium]|nr:hypothetical protein [Gammaproteobacteria bacterium]MCP4089841.1 hypothetical protein [Gammaproteobacteria bacterium]MCP4275496.1 hypothetical protein [Gammaproteobacteria bacterium]MCP4832988.1 hypothetical protein [Gammaproteobacteria bacterium]MCP4928640.1 hypothetical protein [Gammaproteobacteria bacterium]